VVMHPAHFDLFHLIPPHSALYKQVPSTIYYRYPMSLHLPLRFVGLCLGIATGSSWL
jgi:hypothetical protein